MLVKGILNLLLHNKRRLNFSLKQFIGFGSLIPLDLEPKDIILIIF